MTDIALLPCPFCSGEASPDGTVRYGESHAKEQGWNQTEFYYCNCMQCGANNKGIIGHKTRSDAIAAWNRRASPSQVAPANPAQMTDAVAEALVLMVDAFLSRNGGSFPMDEVTKEQRLWKKAMKAAYAVIGQPRTRERDEKLAAIAAAIGAGGQAVAEDAETLKARVASVLCEAGALCGWPAPNCNAREGAEALFKAGLLALSQPHPADERVVEALDDTKRFDKLRNESWDLRCFDIPTGGDDYDIGWRVVGHWMAEPRERTIAEVYHDDPRAAIDEAISSLSKSEGRS